MLEAIPLIKKLCSSDRPTRRQKAACRLPWRSPRPHDVFRYAISADSLVPVGLRDNKNAWCLSSLLQPLHNTSFCTSCPDEIKMRKTNFEKVYSPELSRAQCLFFRFSSPRFWFFIVKGHSTFPRTLTTANPLALEVVRFICEPISLNTMFKRMNIIFKE